jgi:hypothetical protein
VALPLLCKARLSGRAVSRVLALLALARGRRKAPCPHTILTSVIRLTIVRSDAARTVRGVPLDPAPLPHGLLWMIASRLGLGAGTMLAVWAVAAQPQPRVSGAPTLRHGPGLGVAVADAWTGETMAEVGQRLLAQVGRPAAARTDHGSDLHPAAAWLGEDGRASPCLADIAHAAAGRRTRTAHPHPAGARFGSICGRVSGQRTPTLLAC